MGGLSWVHGRIIGESSAMFVFVFGVFFPISERFLPKRREHLLIGTLQPQEHERE